MCQFPKSCIDCFYFLYLNWLYYTVLISFPNILLLFLMCAFIISAYIQLHCLTVFSVIGQKSHNSFSVHCNWSGLRGHETSASTPLPVFLGCSKSTSCHRFLSNQRCFQTGRRVKNKTDRKYHSLTRFYQNFGKLASLFYNVKQGQAHLYLLV